MSKLEKEENKKVDESKKENPAQAITTADKYSNLTKIE